MFFFCYSTFLTSHDVSFPFSLKLVLFLIQRFIYRDDYDTPDGTGIRDYIHVMDLATGHVAALEKLEKLHFGIKMYNLGTGKGVSVLELLKTFEKVNGVSVPYAVEARRSGDICSMYADP